MWLQAAVHPRPYCSGHQPMAFGDLLIVHNGEVYYFEAIRSESIGFTLSAVSIDSLGQITYRSAGSGWPGS